jgi:hypothetical protein
MNTDEILKEIERLPVHKRMYLAKKTLHKIRKVEDFNQMNRAAEAFYSEYTSNTELIAFTDIDFDEFYEAKKDMVWQGCYPLM